MLLFIGLGSVTWALIIAAAVGGALIAYCLFDLWQSQRRRTQRNLDALRVARELAETEAIVSILPTTGNAGKARTTANKVIKMVREDVDQMVTPTPPTNTLDRF